MASSAKEKLDKDSDTDFANVFKFIFKVDKSDAKTNSAVSSFMGDVSGATETSDRNSANVRIYCDQDARWKERVDPKTNQKVGGWEDPDNWLMYNPGGGRSRVGCADTVFFKYITWAQTYRDKMDGDSPETQEGNRAAITICDKTFFFDSGPNSGRPRKGKLLGDIKPGKDLTTIPTTSDANGIEDDGRGTIEILQIQASKILLHEWYHTPPYLGLDKAYYWSGIQGLSASDTLISPDAPAYLGQFALLADRGYTLSRPAPSNAPPEEVAEINAAMKAGKLVKYDNITKRSLQRSLVRSARRSHRNRRMRSLQVARSLGTGSVGGLVA